MENKKEFEKTCPECGVKFLTFNATKKFCCTAHKDRAAQAAYALRNIDTIRKKAVLRKRKIREMIRKEGLKICTGCFAPNSNGLAKCDKCIERKPLYI